MIARIFEKPSMTFAGVRYNTNKMDRNKGELMLKANFGALQALNHPRPQDLINYLMMISAQNTRIKKNTQFHAVISASGRNYDKHTLTRAAVMWLDEMGYGTQPYLIVFHKDSNNNHVHMISSRVGKNGKQINRDFEHDRAVRNIDKVLGYTLALKYKFSTVAQFYMVLESHGFLGRDYRDQEKLQRIVKKHRADKSRIADLKALFIAGKHRPDFVQVLKSNHNIDLIFHASEGKKPYGYTVIDHASMQVFKGSEILNLKILLENSHVLESGDSRSREPTDGNYHSVQITNVVERVTHGVHIGPVMIADDVDDQQVLGMKRRRIKKARINTR